MYSVVLMMALTSGAETPDLFHRHGGCGGGAACYGGGGCYGGNGCHGGGHRLFGGRHHRGHGGHGCCGAVAYSCGGGYGGGCYGGGYYGGGYGGGCYGGAPMMRPGPGPGGPGPEELKKMPKQGEKKTEAILAPATIVVSLPADARLSIDDVATASTSATRTFVSPALEAGHSYHYVLKAEVVRDGKTVAVEERVAVRAGEQTRVSLKLPAEAVVSR